LACFAWSPGSAICFLIVTGGASTCLDVAWCNGVGVCGCLFIHAAQRVWPEVLNTALRVSPGTYLLEARVCSQRVPCRPCYCEKLRAGYLYTACGSPNISKRKRKYQKKRTFGLAAAT
jgi:hypothetical protein